MGRDRRGAPLFSRSRLKAMKTAPGLERLAQGDWHGQFGTISHGDNGFKVATGRSLGVRSDRVVVSSLTEGTRSSLR
jgi:hypothetical protein